MISPEAPTTEDMEYPLLSDRIQSTIIDTFFLVTMMFAIASVLDKFEEVPTSVRILLFFSLWGLYEPLCVTAGCTIGNYLKKIRVRKVTDHSKRINFFQAFIRYLLKISLGWVSFLTIHSNKEKRAIHDLAAGSVMIKVSFS